MNAKASYSAYLVLCTIWILLGILWTYNVITRPAAGAGVVPFICFGTAALFAAWLRGFRLVIENGRFRYRNGLYRWHECELSDIREAEKIKRMINPKPFAQEDLGRLNEMLRPGHNSSVPSGR